MRFPLFLPWQFYTYPTQQVSERNFRILTQRVIFKTKAMTIIRIKVEIVMSEQFCTLEMFFGGNPTCHQKGGGKV